MLGTLLPFVRVLPSLNIPPICFDPVRNLIEPSIKVSLLHITQLLPDYLSLGSALLIRVRRKCASHWLFPFTTKHLGICRQRPPKHLPLHPSHDNSNPQSFNRQPLSKIAPKFLLSHNPQRLSALLLILLLHTKHHLRLLNHLLTISTRRPPRRILRVLL